MLIRTKQAIKHKFNIGSAELTESINRIQSHFELAPEIGISIPLLGIEENYLQEFFHHWFKQNDLPSDKDPLDLEVRKLESDDMYSSLLQDIEIRTKTWSEVKSSLTPEKLAGVSALFYFARELDFSEKYIRIYEDDLREAKAFFAASEEAVINRYFHIFDKMNAACNILQSLYFLRKSEFADRLVVAHGLDEKFSWLDDARKRSLFRKPNYCGYAIQRKVVGDI